MKILAFAGPFLVMFAFACNQTGSAPKMPDYSAADKIHHEAMAIEKQIEALMPKIETAIAAGKDTASLAALVREYRDYQKMIPEIPGEHNHDHAGHDHAGHDHDHDHSHDAADLPTPEAMVAAQQEYKTQMEELLKRFQAVQQ